MPQLVAEEIARFLKQTSLFAILDEEATHRLADRARMQRFSLGETIIEEGDEGRFAYLIFSGRVRALKRSDSGRLVTLGTQTVGEIFGEQAILTDSPRSASVRATEDVVLFRIERADFLELLDRSQNLRQYFEQFIHDRSVRDFLRTQTFLEKLKAKDVISLLDQLEPRDFTPGEVVIREGASAEVMYIVRDGRLKVSRQVSGEELILGYLSDGDFFGERALLTDEPRSASVVTETATRCFALSRKHFDQLLETSPAIREQLTERFSRYDATNELLISARERSESKSAPNVAPSSVRPPSERPAFPSSSGRKYQMLRSSPQWFEPWPWVAQQDEADCGAASLAMVARYFGIRISVERLRRLAQTGYAGASLYSLSAAAADVGFRPESIRTTVDRLAEARLPAIAHWENRHYLVIYQVARSLGEFVVGDPERGLLKLTRRQFEDGWTGRLLELEPTERLEENVPPASMFTRLLQGLRNRVPSRLVQNTAEQQSSRSVSGEKSADPGEPELKSGNIRLENVSFRFAPDGRDALSGINLELMPGQTIAIVGRSGSGKSILSTLLAGQILPTDGRLLIDGRVVSSTVDQISSCVNHLVKDYEPVNGLSIAENIAAGSTIDSELDREAIAQAAELAGFSETINRLPYGFDTPVGNGFAQLSAGEKQRLNIARGSLAEAPLLVLDDLFSAMPTEQARRILLRLRMPPKRDRCPSLVQKRTIVVTSRNVFAIRDADLIVVIDDGHLVESGNHQELIARDGLYSFLWRERTG